MWDEIKTWAVVIGYPAIGCLTITAMGVTVVACVGLAWRVFKWAAGV